ISVPIQNNWEFGYGSANAMRYTANVQPVIPFSISEDWNLPDDQVIHAPVIVYEPVTHASHLPPLDRRKSGPGFFRHLLGRLADDLDAANKRALENSVLEEGFAIGLGDCADKNSASRKTSRSSSTAAGCM